MEAVSNCDIFPVLNCISWKELSKKRWVYTSQIIVPSVIKYVIVEQILYTEVSRCSLLPKTLVLQEKKNMTLTHCWCYYLLKWTSVIQVPLNLSWFFGRKMQPSSRERRTKRKKECTFILLSKMHLQGRQKMVLKIRHSNNIIICLSVLFMYILVGKIWATDKQYLDLSNSSLHRIGWMNLE